MQDRDEPSFDPRTWGSGRPVAAAQDASFDVRSWGNGPTPPPAPPRPPRAPIDPNLRRYGIALGTGAALALAGAVIAFANRSTQIAPPKAEASAALPAQPLATSSRRTLVLAGPAEIEDTLRSGGIVPAEASQAARHAREALGTAPGEIRLIFDLHGEPGAAQLDSLEATRADGAGLVLRRAADGSFDAKKLTAALKTRVTVVRGELDSNSFYSSAVAAGVTDSLISDFANAFSFDFDMQREVAPGDIFEAGFEQAYNPAGEAVGVPRLVYVSLRTAAKSRALYRFTPPGEREAGWFDGNGLSTIRSLMRTPVDSARITSRFGMREHPILGYQKMHRGTDFAAPTGTPIFASGSAVVEFSGPKGANGNFVRLRHDNGWETLYLHMNRILPGVTAGAHVSQGQQIGEVGTTGRSTGPHLHYEVHIDGQPVDPMTIPTGTGQSLSGKALAAFRKERDRIDQQRAATSN
ncbi:M23 family metallopeptidase [Sphingomonas kyeonggiensis]|uniref:Murein DD-endopeptidase MepM/ murein hydrolase activator NlpD n=1 Tax=Sphingomonas kyeonggiensis TaxID=1268553 RepID=A0A7W6JSZ3_9SPHN|nr:M23 family metallopeptidase [Sphingomonas kyeonggiensis]MBB4099013.1 murein DD-endopeptidase MepM/ murein hydrolase activator NlpD [Sphingomonas kyeonggiensis]